MKRWGIFLCSLVLFISCGSADNEGNPPDSIPKKYTRFNGRYNTTFNDLQDVHMVAAQANGIAPLASRADTVNHKDELVRVANEISIYKVRDLTHSVPYLVPKASVLLHDIGINFRDSLISKKLPLYKLVVTSILRTDDDVARLTRRNTNASENSVHRYGTTFDISWTRYEKVNANDKRTLDDGRLKAILGQVLHDLHQRDRCYIKHERKQSCFHITVR